MNSLNKTFLPTKNYKNRNWFIIDCKGQKLGRLATIIAALLKGKIKPHYIKSVDIGDSIILINADSIIINQDSQHYIVNNPARPGRSLKIKGTRTARSRPCVSPGRCSRSSASRSVTTIGSRGA